MKHIWLLIVCFVLTGCPVESSDSSGKAKESSLQEAREATTSESQVDHIEQARGQDDMKEEFIKFVQSPNRETFVALREKVISDAAYDPYSDEIHDAGELFENDKFEEALSKLQDAMPNLMLSPCAHNMIGYVHHKLGNSEAAQMEVIIGEACLQGILSTGDGSKANPYVVLRTSDEYDVLKHFEKSLKTQSLQNEGEKHFDLLQCTDGTEYWFDITDAMNNLSKKFGQ